MGVGLLNLARLRVNSDYASFLSPAGVDRLRTEFGLARLVMGHQVEMVSVNTRVTWLAGLVHPAELGAAPPVLPAGLPVQRPAVAAALPHPPPHLRPLPHLRLSPQHQDLPL